jgi:heterodisulfide reductase subunit A
MVHKSVLTQTQLEERIATGVLDTSQLASVAMIQCVESREEPRNYCSRVCCQGALKNILMLKRKNPDIRIYVFYRDMMSYGFHETFYTQARKAGAVFIRYDVDRKPQVRFDQGKPVITAPDPILGREVEVRADLLALSVGMEPNEPEELLEIFGVEVDKDGFYQEAESKWRPLDFMKQGVFMCGSAHAPKSMGEAIASAQAAAQRAMRILSAEKLIRERVVATVRHSLCSLCLSCVEACPYEARRMDMDLDRIVVDEILCQGCGSCAAVCPNSATVLDGFHDGQVMSVIDEALSAASVLPEPAPVE